MSTPRMEVEITPAPQQTVVRIKGEARVPEAGVLERCMLGLQAQRPALVVFDLSELRFISSLAMGVLVTCRRGLVRNGAQVRFLPVLQEFVRGALERAGLLQLFEIPPAAAAPARDPLPTTGPDAPAELEAGHK